MKNLLSRCHEINPKANIVFWILFCFVLSRFSVLAFSRLLFGYWGLHTLFDKFNTYDAVWYIKYAESLLSGTFPGEIFPSGAALWAFFPLYPLILAILSKLTFGLIPISVLGTVFSSVCMMGAEYVVYLYIMETRPESQSEKQLQAKAFIAFLSFGLYSYFFSMVYTESLALLLTSLCFYHMVRKEYIKMGLFGMLLSATRNTGILFVFALLVWRIQEYLKEHGKGRSLKEFIIENLKQERLILGVCLVPAGLFSFMLYLKISLGDAFAFIRVQKAWERETVGLWKVLCDSFRAFPLGPLVIFSLGSVFCILICLRHHHRFYEMVIPLIIFFVSSTQALESMPRYMIGAMTVLLGFTDEYGKWDKLTKAIVFLSAAIIELHFLWAWITGIAPQY